MRACLEPLSRLSVEHACRGIAARRYYVDRLEFPAVSAGLSPASLSRLCVFPAEAVNLPGRSFSPCSSSRASARPSAVSVFLVLLLLLLLPRISLLALRLSGRRCFLPRLSRSSLPSHLPSPCPSREALVRLATWSLGYLVTRLPSTQAIPRYRAISRGRSPSLKRLDLASSRFG